MNTNKYMLLACVLCVCICILISAKSTTGASDGTQIARYSLVANAQGAGFYVLDGHTREMWYRPSSNAMIYMGTLDKPVNDSRRVAMKKGGSD